MSLWKVPLYPSCSSLRTGRLTRGLPQAFSFAALKSQPAQSVSWKRSSSHLIIFVALTCWCPTCAEDPELNTALQVWSSKNGVEGQNHLPLFSLLLMQETVGFLSCKCTLSYVYLPTSTKALKSLSQGYSQSILLWDTICHFPDPPCRTLNLVSLKVMRLLKAHLSGPIKVDDLLSLQHVKCTTQFGAGKLPKDSLNATVQVNSKDIENHWSQYQPLKDGICNFIILYSLHFCSQIQPKCFGNSNTSILTHAMNQGSFSPFLTLWLDIVWEERIEDKELKKSKPQIICSKCLWQSWV